MLIHHLNKYFTQYTLHYYKDYVYKKNKPPYNEPLEQHIIAHNIDLVRKDAKYPEYNSASTIACPFFPFMTSFHKIIKTHGNPETIAEYRLNKDILKIVSFKNMEIANSKHILYYFFNNLLVAFEYILFSVGEDDYQSYIYENVTKMYDIKGIGIIKDGFYIEDKNNNRIFSFWNGFEYSFKILSGDAGAYIDSFNNYYNNNWRLPAKQQNSEFIMNELTSIVSLSKTDN